MANITEFPIPTKVLDPADYPEFVGATGAAGADGADGAAGDDGADGKTVLNGAVDPTSEGVDGDFYINTASNEIFGPKAAGVWGTGTSLVGPTGATGATGATGPAGDVSSPDDSVATIVELTQDAYDELDPKVADRLYLIVD